MGISAASANDRIRHTYRRLAAEMETRGGKPAGYDRMVALAYVYEGLLKELSWRHGGKTFTVKGGSLFRWWRGPLDARPTEDLDLQLIDPDADPEAFRDGVFDYLCSAEFATATGLSVDRNAFEIQAIKEGQIEHCYRIAGHAHLGERRMKLVIEISRGAIPAVGLESRYIEPLIPLTKGDAFTVTTARRELMLADKLRAAYENGIKNTRLKDFYDVVSLFEEGKLDADVVRECLGYAFSGIGATMPRTVEDAPQCYTMAFATADKEATWQKQRLPEWLGRPFDPQLDLTLAEAVEGIGMHLEAAELLERRSSTAKASHALVRLLAADSAVEAAQALQQAAAAVEAADMERVSARMRYAMVCSGSDKLEPITAFDAKVASLKARGLLTDGMGAAVAAIAARLHLVAPTISSGIDPRSSSHKAKEREDAPDPVVLAKDAFASGVQQRWIAALLSLLNGGHMVHEVPEPPLGWGRTKQMWANIARRSGVQADLDVAVASVQQDCGRGLRA